MAIVIGVTGGIATGKSTVLKILAELGAETLSADDIAREVLSKNSQAYNRTVTRFGDRILAPNGEIDRSVLASIIFSDSDARQDLNKITHPFIIARIQERIDRFRNSHLFENVTLAVEIPLLIECGLEEIVDKVLVVAAEPETQIRRLTTRSEISPDEALQRINAQMPLARKIERADRVIWNDGSYELLRRSVEALWNEIHLL